jgi:hypothetical protein
MTVVKVLYPDGWKLASSRPWPPEKAQDIVDTLRRYGIKAKLCLA